MVISRIMFGLVLAFLFSSPGGAIDIALEPAESERHWIEKEFPLGVCKEVPLGQHRELPIYRDFTLLGLIEIDAKSRELLRQSALLGSFTGVLHLNRLGAPRRLKSLEFLSQMIAHNRSKRGPEEALFVPVMLCGNDAYHGYLGYLEPAALRLARQEDFGADLPPSTQGNPIPRLP